MYKLGTEEQYQNFIVRMKGLMQYVVGLMQYVVII